jgi:hypothetical protein
MYSRSRFNTIRPEAYAKKNNLETKPSQEIPVNNVDTKIHNISENKEMSPLIRFLDKDKPLFKFGNISVYLDDIIIIGVIIFLLIENNFRDNKFLLPMLIYILLEGK